MQQFTYTRPSDFDTNDDNHQRSHSCGILSTLAGIFDTSQVVFRDAGASNRSLWKTLVQAARFQFFLEASDNTLCKGNEEVREFTTIETLLAALTTLGYIYGQPIMIYCQMFIMVAATMLWLSSKTFTNGILRSCFKYALLRKHNSKSSRTQKESRVVMES